MISLKPPLPVQVSRLCNRPIILLGVQFGHTCLKYAEAGCRPELKCDLLAQQPNHGLEPFTPPPSTVVQLQFLDLIPVSGGLARCLGLRDDCSTEPECPWPRCKSSSDLKRRRPRTRCSGYRSPETFSGGRPLRMVGRSNGTFRRPSRLLESVYVPRHPCLGGSLSFCVRIAGPCLSVNPI